MFRKNASNDEHDVLRHLIRQSLGAITAKTQLRTDHCRTRLSHLSLHTHNGRSLVTFASPLDPSDDGLDRIMQIVREMEGQMIGAARLTARASSCVLAGAAAPVCRCGGVTWSSWRAEAEHFGRAIMAVAAQQDLDPGVNGRECARSADAAALRSHARPDVAPGAARHPPGGRRHRTPRSAGNRTHHNRR
jgi:hypothetical protein